MLINHRDILDLLKEEGLSFYLETRSSSQPAIADYGISERVTVTRKQVYGTFDKPSNFDNVALPGGSTQKGELICFFSGFNLSRAELESSRNKVIYNNQHYTPNYLAEVTHQGVILMHQVKLVAIASINQ